MKKTIKIFIVMFLILSFVGPSRTVYATSTFSDVPANHSARYAIDWAVKNKILSGYGNGKFGPNDFVTEQQFVQMITNYLKLPQSRGSIEKLYDNASTTNTAYEKVAAYSIPLNGYLNDSIRKEPITRGVVAQSLAALVGDGGNLKQSIQFLLDNKITSGLNPQYLDKDVVKFFGAQNTLTRAQIVVFLNNLSKKGFTSTSANANARYQNALAKDLTTLAKSSMANVDSALVKKPQLFKKLYSTAPQAMKQWTSPIIGDDGSVSLVYFTKISEYANSAYFYDKNGKPIINLVGKMNLLFGSEAYLSGNNLKVIGLNDTHYYNKQGKLVKKEATSTNVTYPPVIVQGIDQKNGTMTFLIDGKTTFKYKPQVMLSDSYPYIIKGKNHYAITYNGFNADDKYESRLAVLTKQGVVLHENKVTHAKPGNDLIVRGLLDDGTVITSTSYWENDMEMQYFNKLTMDGKILATSQLSRKDYLSIYYVENNHFGLMHISSDEKKFWLDIYRFQ